MKAQVLGLSVDSADCLKAWAEDLGGISYPLLSDFFPHGGVSESYGVFRPEGYSERAIFVIDKDGMVRYVDVHDIGKQPDNGEIIKVLAELEPEAAALLPTLKPPKKAGKSPKKKAKPSPKKKKAVKKTTKVKRSRPKKK